MSIDEIKMEINELSIQVALLRSDLRDFIESRNYNNECTAICQEICFLNEKLYYLKVGNVKKFFDVLGHPLAIALAGNRIEQVGRNVFYNETNHDLNLDQ